MQFTFAIIRAYKILSNMGGQNSLSHLESRQIEEDMVCRENVSPPSLGDLTQVNTFYFNSNVYFV